MRGVMPAVVFGLWMLAGSELATRVWVLPEERENWALPFLSLRMLCTVQLLQRSHPRWPVEPHRQTQCERNCPPRNSVLLASLWTSTLLFGTCWQFAPFVLAVQAIAALLVFLTHTITARTLRLILSIDLTAFGCTTVLLGGNTIYTAALFAPLAFVVLATTHDDKLCTANGSDETLSLSTLCMAPRLPKKGCLDLGRYVILCTLGVGIRLCAALVLKGAVVSVTIGGSTSADDDQHITQLLRCKIFGAGPRCHDFFSLLYLCEGVFGYGTASDATFSMKLLLAPALTLVVGGVFVRILFSRIGTMMASALDADVAIATPAPHMIYLSFVSVGYLLLAGAVARLKYLAVPYLAVTASSMFVPPIEWLFSPLLPLRNALSDTATTVVDNDDGREARRESFQGCRAQMLHSEPTATADRTLSDDTLLETAGAHRHSRARLLHLLSVVVQLGCAVYIGAVAHATSMNIQNIAAKGRHGPNSFNSVTRWLNANVDEGAVVGATLQMAAHIRLSTNLRGVVHPHAENFALRRRATSFYKLFGHTAVAEMYTIARDMGINYIVFDRYSCTRQCIIDGERVGGYEYLVHEGHPERARSIHGPGKPKVPKLCTIVTDDNYHARLLPPFFQRVYVPNNRAYFVVKVLDVHGEDQHDQVYTPPAHPPRLTAQQQLAAQGATMNVDKGFTAPCFGIVGSTFVSKGTTMDAELYAAHLPNATHIVADTADDYSYGVRAVIHIESIDERRILTDTDVLHLFMVNPDTGIAEIHTDAAMRAVDIVLCKSRQCVELMQNYRRRTAGMRYGILYTNHTTPDPLAHVKDSIPPPPDYTRWLHLAGKSIFKNTEAVLHAWLNDPTLPHLTVLLHGLLLQRLRNKHPEWFDVDNPPRTNLQLITEPLSTEAVAALLVACGVHLCPSAREGFGHYINEARAASALVVTVDAAPMHDFVTDGVSGVLLHRHRQRPIGNNMFALQDVQVGAEAIVEVVRRVEALPLVKRAALGAAARARYEQERYNFGRTMEVRVPHSFFNSILITQHLLFFASCLPRLPSLHLC